MHLEHRRGEAGRVDLAPHRPAAVAGLVDRLTSHPRAASAGPIRHHVPAIEDSPWISSTRPRAGPVGAQRGSGQLS